MFTRNLNKLNYQDVAIAGGKGASLGEMVQAGIPVPPGFVILARAFAEFLAATDLVVEIAARMDKVNYNEMASIDNAAAIIRDLINSAAIPENIEKEILTEFKNLKVKYVAVRSSATAEDSVVASFAGELETYLDTRREQLLSNVRNCWSSLFTPRAIFYRHEKNLINSPVGVAVVVQKMVESEVAGIAFTVHSVTEDHNQMIIEAGFGLGEAIVSGQITPDAYVVNKTDLSILDINISEQQNMIVRAENGGVCSVDVSKTKINQQKLSGELITELSRICLNIEKHYGKPQDIKWAVARGKIYITQSRPITTLKK